MNKCKECGIETTNPKFCSRSCAATFNNRGVRRHGKPRKHENCLNCEKPLVYPQKKYCSLVCQGEFRSKQVVDAWLQGKDSGVTGVTPQIKKAVRSYLIKQANNVCSICGWSGVNPVTGEIPLEIDHIDGDHKNNRPSNLRVLCPNCHSLTPTYKSLNNGNGRSGRK